MRSQSELTVPRALSVWFIIHFIADMMLAVPLFLFPERTLEFFGWEQVDVVMARVVAAALFGIGIDSFLVRKSSIGIFKNMLDLKIIWSGMASVAILWSLLEGAQGTPDMAWTVLGVIVIFHFVWWYWRFKVEKLSNDPVK
jgi:hypothetical protein